MLDRRAGRQAADGCWSAQPANWPLGVAVPAVSPVSPMCRCASRPPAGPGARGSATASSAPGLFSGPRACGSAAPLPPVLGCVLLDLCVCCAGRRLDSEARRPRDAWAWAGVSCCWRRAFCKLQDELASPAGVLGQCWAVWAVVPGTGVLMLSAAVSAASLPSLCAVLLRRPLFFILGVCVAHGVPAVAARRTDRFPKLCAWVAGVRSGLGPALAEAEEEG